MPSARKKTTKDGRVFYEISVSRGRGKSRLTRRWYVPEGWSQKAIDRELAAVAAEFERQSDAGEVISRAEARSGGRRGRQNPYPQAVWGTCVHANKGRHNEREQPFQLSRLPG